MQEKVKNKQKEKRNKSAKSIQKQAKGITLIALVITIIVLLILAAVSIATLTGENGILTRANDARTETEEAEEREAIQLAYAGAVAEKRGTGDVTADDLNREFGINGTNATAEDGADGTITVTFGAPSNRVYTIDADGNKATIPAGFVVSEIPEEQKISTGLVIYDIPADELESVNWTATNADGAYQVQTLYNQFVWIPVATEEEYIRDFSYPSWYASDLEYTPEGSTFTDTGYLPEGIQGADDETAERNAVMKYNGFYIARYEAGQEGTTVISKQDATVYTNETQTEFKNIAKTMYTGSAVKSAMCSGIQWDMVMKFVDGKNDAKGNTYNVRVYDANRHNGTGVTGSGKNEYDKVQNIYDLEGNCFEWVAEKNNTSRPIVS